MWKYTPKFKSAYKRVLEVLEEHGEAEAKKAFRTEMLKIGHQERVNNLYRVKDKLTSNAVPFRRNGPQKRFAESRTGRDLVLKIRQVGFTTQSCVEALDLALWEQNTATGIMAHKQNVVQTIFTDIVKFSYEWFKKDWGKLYKPTENADSSSALRFKDDGQGRPLNSSMQVLFDFRGKTINYLHVSEAAFIEDKRLAGSLNGVPANGTIILESTANGQGGEFHRQYQLYKKLRKQAPYKAFFIPWYEFYPERITDPKWDLDESVELTEYEQQILKDNPNQITPRHIAWRRWCIEANCQGSIEVFEQEYPSNDIDCFLSGEASVFSRKVIKAQLKNCSEPRKSGFILSENNKKFTFEEDVGIGLVDIWDLPNPATSYVIGADTAAGVGKDKAAAYVKDQKSKKIVARIWADLEPQDFGKELYKLANYYNKAWINPEVNNHGAVVVQVLKDLGYGNIYKRKVRDEYTEKLTNKIGFLTTNDSKMRITENFKMACRDGQFIVTDAALISEMTTFMQYASKNGRTFKREASPGTHDDLVMAACLTHEMDLNRQVSFNDSAAEYNPYARGNFDSDTGFLN
jgi:hypothetical protein